MTYQARVTEAGELIVPAEMAREMGLHPGDAFSLDRNGSAIMVRSYAETVRDGQQAFRSMLAAPFVVADFIADRRAEAARD